MVTLAILPPTRSSALPCFDYEEAAGWKSFHQTEGSTWRRVVEDDLMYVAVRGEPGKSGLYIFNIADPDRSFEVGFLPSTYPSEVSKQGDLLLLGDRRDRAYHFVDVSDPTNPRRLHTFRFPNDTARGSAIEGNRAWVSNITGVWSFDVSDPSAPVPLGSFAARVGELHVSGHYLFTARDGIGLQVRDVSDTAPRRLIATLVTPSNDARDLALSGNFVYVADGRSGLQVVDVSKPAEPRIVGSLYDPAWGWTHEIDVEGDFVVIQGNELFIIDVSDPEHPVQIATVPGIGGYASIEGGRLFSTWEYVGFAIGDILGGPPPPILFEEDTGDVWDVDSVGENVITVGGGMHVLRLSPEGDPIFDRFLPMGGVALGVATRGKLAYVAASGHGVQVVDLRNPESPTLLTTVPTLSRAQDTAVESGYLIVGTGISGGLETFDLTDPRAPIRRGALAVPGAVWRVDATPTHALVANGLGLVVVDVTDLDAPRIDAVMDLPGTCRGVVHLGDFAYVASGTTGIHVVDISEPTTPWVVSRVAIGGWCQSIALDGAHLYATNWRRLAVLDLVDPRVPRLIGQSSGLTWTDAVHVTPGLAVVSRGRFGFGIFPRHCAPATAPRVDRSAAPVGRQLLISAAPNPFAGQVTLTTSLPSSGPLHLTVFDVRGRRVAQVYNGVLSGGVQQLAWDGLDLWGRQAPAGVYFVRGRSSGQVGSIRVVRTGSR